MTAIKTAQELGQLARTARLRAGLSQREVAGLGGVGLRFVSDLENGKPTLRLDKALAVLSALGIGLAATERRGRPERLGALSSNLRRFERRSEQAEAKVNLAGIFAACRAFHTERGRYPRTLAEAEWSPGAATRYLYLLNVREPVGGEASPNRRRLVGIARRKLQELGIRVGGRKKSFLAAAVTFREGEEVHVDVWTVDAEKKVVSWTPEYAEEG